MKTHLKRTIIALAAALSLLLVIGLTQISMPVSSAQAQGAATATMTMTSTPTQVISATETTTYTIVTATPQANVTIVPYGGATVVPVIWTATPGSNTVITNTNGASDSDRLCLGDKIATVNELNFAGPQRMEISTGDLIHLDYYQDSGKPSVGVLVRTGEVAVLKGYGSEWQFPLRDCGATYDFVKDATDYAMARMQWNHSGLVYNSLQDWLDNKAPIVNLYHVDYTLPQYRPVFWENKTAPALTPATTSTPVASNASQCGDGIRTDYPAVENVTIQPNANHGYVVQNFWTNMSGKPQGERKLLLTPNDDPSLYGGGAAWYWPANCNGAAQASFDKNTHSPVTLTELENEGLVQ